MDFAVAISAVSDHVVGEITGNSKVVDSANSSQPLIGKIAQRRGLGNVIAVINRF